MNWNTLVVLFLRKQLIERLMIKYLLGCYWKAPEQVFYERLFSPTLRLQVKCSDFFHLWVKVVSSEGVQLIDVHR